MNRFFKFVERRFEWLGPIGLVFGLFFSDYLAFVNGDMLAVLLFLMLLFSILKSDFGSFVNYLKQPVKPLILTVVKLFVLPILVFILSLGFSNEIRLGLFLLAMAPAAISAPGLMALFGGNISLTLVVTILTNSLIPLVAPFLLVLFFGSGIEIELWHLAKFLSMMVFLPLLIAFLMKKYFPSQVDSFNRRSNLLIALLVFVFAIVVIVPYKDVIFSDLSLSLMILVLAVSMAILSLLMGVFIELHGDRNARMTSSITFVFQNAGLMTLIAVKYFGEVVILTTVMYQMIWSFGFVPVKYFFAERKKRK